jgi:hypothetical protein
MLWLSIVAAYAFMLMIILQFGYLAGFLLSSAWTRVASREPSHISICRR